MPDDIMSKKLGELTVAEFFQAFQKWQEQAEAELLGSLDDEEEEEDD